MFSVHIKHMYWS